MSVITHRDDTVPVVRDDGAMARSEAARVAQPARTTQPARTARKEMRVFSLTGVCFVFGGLLAMQLRAIERVQAKKADEQKAQTQIEMQAVKNRVEAAKAEKETATLQKQLTTLRGQLTSGTLGAQKKEQLLKQLNARIKELQLIAGLTPVSGPGIRIVMSDSPEVSGAVESNNPFVPGIVHDFDLLQVVNELRAASAEAIAINGTRITGYTPIRCVGTSILINNERVPPPFRIEAIGDADSLYTQVNMAGGIIKNLQNPEVGPALEIKLTRASRLLLPAAGGAPRLKAAKIG